MFGALRKEVGEILGRVCKMEEVTIIKAATLPDHVHMYVSIPPKLSVSKVVGRIKGKSALMIFDRYPEYRERYNRHFWALPVAVAIGIILSVLISNVTAKLFKLEK
jgi:putative transposase